MSSSNQINSYWQHWKLILVLLFGGVLRFTNLHHGIGTDALHFAPYNGDEVYSMQGLQYMDPEKLKFNPVSGHREGSVGYYMWIGAAIAMHSLGIIEHFPIEVQPGDPDYNKVAYASRVVVTLSDLAIIILVYLCLLKIPVSLNLAALGTLLFAIVPYEILMAQELRPHVISSLWAMLAIYLSFFLYEKRGYTWVMLIGLITALAAATRYHLGITLLFPALVLIGVHFFSETSQARFSFSNWSGFIKKILLLCISFICGFIIADHYLIFDFETARPALEFQKSFASYDEFSSISQFLSTRRLWVYLENAIPFGASYFLWVIFYFSFIYCLFLRKYYKKTIPIILFSLAYLFIITKIYYFMYERPSVRAIILLFPLFAITSGISLFELYKKINKSKVIKYLVNIIVLAIIVSAIVVDVAYLKLVGEENDINLKIYNYFSNLENANPLQVGYAKTGRDYIITTLYLLDKERKITLLDKKAQLDTALKEEFIDKTPALDYVFLTSFFEDPKPIVEELMASNRYELIKFIQSIDVPYPKKLLPLDFPFVNEYYLLKVKKN
jgi:hypothetical protein